MKHIVAFLIIFISVAVGCNNIPDYRISAWPKIDAEFDSIAALLDECRWKMDGDVAGHMHALRNAFQHSPNKDRLEGRMMYWEGYALRLKTHNTDSCKIYILHAMEQADSSKYPYDYARFKFLDLPPASSNPMQLYHILRDSREVFHRYGDSAMTAMADVELANLFEYIGNSHLAIENYNSALSRFRKSGLDYVLPRVKMNKAISLTNIGQKDTAVRILDSLLRDSVMTDILALRHLALMNNYLVRGDTTLLREAYRISCSFPFLISTQAFESVELGEYFLKNGSPDSASFYINQAYNNIDRLSDLNDRQKLLAAVLDLAAAQGKPLPHDAFLQYRLISDSIAETMANTNIINAESRHRIKELERLENTRINRHRLAMWIISLCAIIMVISAVAILLRYKNKILKEKHEIELRLQKNRESFAAFKLHQKKTLDILEEFETEIDRNRNNPENTVKLMAWLGRQIKMHKIKSREWDSITETFDKIHPSFETKLLSTYPGLSKKQVEFAGFIALGLSSKQIAEILSIDVASVNTNRYRLRTKMGLQKSQSLEETLMAILPKKQ